MGLILTNLWWCQLGVVSSRLDIMINWRYAKELQCRTRELNSVSEETRKKIQWQTIFHYELPLPIISMYKHSRCRTAPDQQLCLELRSIFIHTFSIYFNRMAWPSNLFFCQCPSPRSIIIVKFKIHMRIFK